MEEQWFLCEPDSDDEYDEYAEDEDGDEDEDEEYDEYGHRIICPDCGALLAAYVHGQLYCPICGWEEEV